MVTAGHCCSLARQDDEAAERTVELGRQSRRLGHLAADVQHAYLQDRYPDRTPRWRGVTLFKELAAAGVETAVSSDNTRDPFYAYGDLDPVGSVPRGRSHPASRPSARYCGACRHGVAGRDCRPAAHRPHCRRQPRRSRALQRKALERILSRPQADRIVLRRGKVIDRSLPDYRELDTVVGARDMPDYQKIKKELEGIAVEDNPALVRQKSRDFYWYSPILKAQLEGVTADLVVDAQERGRGDPSPRRCAFAHGVPVTPRGAGTGNYGQAMPLSGGIVLNLAAMDKVKEIHPGR